MSLVSVVCCQVEVSATGPIPRPEASYRVDESPSAIKSDITPLLQGSSVCVMRPTATFVVYVDTVHITIVLAARYCTLISQ